MSQRKIFLECVYKKVIEKDELKIANILIRISEFPNEDISKHLYPISEIYPNLQLSLTDWFRRIPKCF